MIRGESDWLIYFLSISLSTDYEESQELSLRMIGLSLFKFIFSLNENNYFLRPIFCDFLLSLQLICFHSSCTTKSTGELSDLSSWLNIDLEFTILRIDCLAELDR